MLLVFAPVGVGCVDHDDIDRAARISRSGGPPFLAVEDVFVPLAHAGHGNVGRIRGGDAGFRHQIGRADAPFEQRFEPALLLFGAAVTLEHLHVARVGRVAVEDFGGQMALAHLLRKIGIFDRGQPRAAIAVRQPEIPQPFGLRLRLEPFENLGLPLGELPAVSLGDFGKKFLIRRHDVLADHLGEAGMNRREALRHSKIHPGSHGSLPLFVAT